MDTLTGKRVLVATFFPKHVGGLQTHFDLLCKQVERRGIKVFNAQRKLDNVTLLLKALLYASSGFKKERAVVRLLNKRIEAFSNSLLNIVRTQSVDLAHCHDVFAVYCLKDLPLPIVLTVHGPLSREFEMLGWRDKKSLEWLRFIEKTAYNRADIIIAVDTGQQDYIIREFGIEGAKIRVIHNAVDVQEIAALSVANPEDRVVEKKPFVLVPRRLVPKNGVSVAIKAMRFLTDLPVNMVIAGDGPERGELEKITVKCDLQAKVIFLGEVKREDLFPLIKHSVAVVIPSIPVAGVVEATSLSALEAMSLGRVVVASAIGGLQEIIDDGVDGFLFETGNEKKLAEILRRMVLNKNLCDSIGEAARRKIISRYDVSIWLDKILDLYSEVLNNARKQ